MVLWLSWLSIKWLLCADIFKCMFVASICCYFPWCNILLCCILFKEFIHLFGPFRYWWAVHICNTGKSWKYGLKLIVISNGFPCLSLDVHLYLNTMIICGNLIFFLWSPLYSSCGRTFAFDFTWDHVLPDHNYLGCN